MLRTRYRLLKDRDNELFTLSSVPVLKYQRNSFIDKFVLTRTMSILTTFVYYYLGQRSQLVLTFIKCIQGNLLQDCFSYYKHFILSLLNLLKIILSILYSKNWCGISNHPNFSTPAVVIWICPVAIIYHSNRIYLFYFRQ